MEKRVELPQVQENTWQRMSSPSPSLLESRSGYERAVAIPASEALRALRHDRMLTRAAVKIPFPMFYFLVYVLMIYAHIPAAALYKQSSALTSTLATAGSTTVTEQTPMQFYNIQTVSDVWDWLEKTLAPAVFITTDINGVDLPTAYNGRIATYNQVLGSVRFTVTFAEPVSCDNQGFLHSIYADCHNWDNTASVEQLFSTTLNTTEAVTEFENMKAQYYINNATTEFKIDVVTYNAELDSYAVTKMKLEFQEGGLIDLSANTLSSKSTFYFSPEPYVMDALVAFCFVCVVAGQLRGLCRNRSQLMAHVMNFWNLIDYCSTLLVIAFYAVWGVVVSTVLDNTFRGYIAQLSNDGVFALSESEAVTVLDSIIFSLEKVANLNIALRLIATVTILFLGIRILGRFHFHPRLNVLSQTIANSLAKFGAFFIVCAIVIVMFAISGHVIFGDRSKEFSTTASSLMACVNILFGNFDYGAIDGINGVVSIIYYWVYVVVSSLILLNMMLAIVLDAYEEVSEKAYSDTTVTSMRRMAYIACYDTLLWFHDLRSGVCCKKSRFRSVNIVVEEHGSSELMREEVIFLGRIRPDVLEAVLEPLVSDDLEVGAKGTLELTPQSLRRLFSNAIVTDAEARATIDYLEHGLLPVDDDDDESEEENKPRRLSMMRKLRKSGRRPDKTVVVPPPVEEAAWGTFTNPEVQHLTDRIASLEQKLDLLLTHSLR